MSTWFEREVSLRRLKLQRAIWQSFARNIKKLAAEWYGIREMTNKNSPPQKTNMESEEGPFGKGKASIQTITRWWFQIFFYFHPYLGKWSNLTNIFQMGWNHQLDQFSGFRVSFRRCKKDSVTRLWVTKGEVLSLVGYVDVWVGLRNASLDFTG